MTTNELFWRFITDNAKADTSRLRLKYYNRNDVGFDVDFAILQIECRRKFGKKLATTLADNPRFLFSSMLAGEQSTSDMLAAYHTTIAEPFRRAIDLTAGLGIDALHLATKGEVVAIELDHERVELLRYNASGKCIDVIEGDCADFLRDYEGLRFDVAFIDPARRASDGSRVYALKDCAPDVVSLLPAIDRIADKLIIKMSPMLDITSTMAEIGHKCKIIAVGTPTECKELVAIIDFKEQSEAVVEAVTISNAGINRFVIDAVSSQLEYGVPEAGNYLYEPYPSVMKTGAWNQLCHDFGWQKLSPNSQVFFSNSLVENSPAEPFEIVAVLPFASKVIKRFKREYPRVNIACRNFMCSPEQLRRQLGVTEGGELRLVASRDFRDEPLLIIAKPLRKLL